MINGKKINKVLFIKIVLWLSLIVFLGFLFYKGYLEDYVSGFKKVMYTKEDCKKVYDCDCTFGDPSGKEGFDDCICHSKVFLVPVSGYCSKKLLVEEQINKDLD